MLRIPCPHCGERDQSEFDYGGDATKQRPTQTWDVSAEDWDDYLYKRDNPAGVHCEYWQHVFGCRAWFKLTRNTVTHEIEKAEPLK